MRPLVLISSAILLLAVQAHEGAKNPRHAFSTSNAGSNSFASSSSYSGGGSFNTGIKGGGGYVGAGAGASAGAGYSGAGASAGAAGPFWWAGADSPFKQAQEFFQKCHLKGNCAEVPSPLNFANVPNNGCDGNGCSFSGGFNIHDKPAGSTSFGHAGVSGAASNGGPIDISKNPFLNGEYQGIAVSSCSGNACPGGQPQTVVTTTNCKGSDCKTNTQHGAAGAPIDLSGNPFLNGGFGAGAAAGQGCGPSGCAGSSGSYGGTATGTQGAGCGSSGCGGSTASGSFSGTSGSFSGSYGNSGSFGQTGTGCTAGNCAQPGQPGQYNPGSGCAGTKGGCSGSTGQFGSTIHGSSHQGSFGTTQQGSSTGEYSHHTGSNSGHSTSAGHTSFAGGAQTIPTSYPGSPQTIPTAYPGNGSPQTIPTAYPGQAQPIPTSQPGFGGSTNSFGGSSNSFGGSSNTGSYQPQGIPSSYPGQPGQNSQSIPTTYPTGSTSFGSTSGTFGHSQTQFGSSGQKTDHTSGQTTSGVYGQPSYTSGSQQGTGSFGGSTSFGSSGSKSPSVETSYPDGGQVAPGAKYPAGETSYPSGGQIGQNAGHGQSHTTGQHQGGFNSGSQTTSGSFGGSTSFGTGQGAYGKAPSASLTKCYGQGLICVQKHLCLNGFVNKNGEGLFQVRSGETYCDQTETCCQLPNTSGQPHKEIPIHFAGGSTPGAPGTYFTSNTHQSSSSAASSASSSSSSNTNTFISHGPGPTPSADIASRYTPAKYPDSNPAGSNAPGQTIPFAGKAGTSPGLIHIVPEDPQAQPGLIQFGPGSNTPGFTNQKPGFTHILPNGQVSPSPDVYPNSGAPQGNDYNFKDLPNELGSASTVTRGPAYLPPGPSPSPSPSPSSYSQDLIPPRPSSNPYTTAKPNTYYSGASTNFNPAPTNYYPSSQPTTGYVPPQTRPSTGYVPQPTVGQPQVTNNGYLPPISQIPEGSSDDNNYLPPPITPDPSDTKIVRINVIPPSNPDRVPSNTDNQETRLRPQTSTDYPQNTTPYPGCAAALKCVQGDFCTAEGVISTTRVLLTPAQEINRVPVTDCGDPETGIVGKCCRDPNYVDPWPASVLGQYRPDLLGFDNGQYKQTTKTGQYKPPVKGGRPINNRPFEANQIGSPSNNPNTFIRPDTYPTPNSPYDNRQVNVPLVVEDKQPNQYNQKYPISASKISGESCGQRHPGLKPTGQGPIDADFAEIPWQAMVLRDTNRSLLCGGTIIRRDVVLTAAHCVENLQANDVLVKGGEWKLGIDEEPKPFQINKVLSIVRHPGYRPENKFNDVALLILEDKFRTDKNVDTLCLPSPGEDIAKTFQGAKCITSGWGKTTLQLNILNSVMHILGVGILPSSQCQQQLQQYHSDSAYLYNTNCVCGAPVQPQTDICDVDVGSALACDRGDGRYTLAGVYSWDTGCNPTAQIAGYTKVDTQWIESTLQRPLKDLKTEESGFYAQLTKQECHCAPGK